MRNKYEQTFCSKLGKWWDNEGYKVLGKGFYPVEAKISLDNKPFNFKSGLKPHQIPTLLKYQESPMHWKISDIDTLSSKHYDLHFSHPLTTASFLAIMWIRPRNKTFYLINPKQIALLIEQGYKSLTEVMADSICDYKGEVR